jgi:hypothetical protein
MQYLRRARRCGPKTFAAWTAIGLAIVLLGGFSIWSS